MLDYELINDRELNEIKDIFQNGSNLTKEFAFSNEILSRLVALPINIKMTEDYQEKIDSALFKVLKKDS